MVCLACGPTVVYEETRTVANGSGWSYQDSLVFTPNIPSDQQVYDLELVVEHGEDFPYENFYLKIHTTPPSGLRTTELISLDISGDFGAWHGDCGGGICELPIALLQNTRFQEAGTYRIVLEQNSRDNPLPAIQSVGLRLSETP